MKKPILLWIFIAVCTTFLMAADIDTEVKNAVNGLASRLTSPIEISVGEIYLEGTTSVSELSQVLANRINAHAPNTGKFIVVPLSRGLLRPMAGGIQRGTIKGTYQPIGSIVYITLQLVENLPDGSTRTITSQDIKIPLADLERDRIGILPANFKTQEDVKEQENLFLPPATPPSQIIQDSPSVPSDNAQTLQIFAWPNSDTNIYSDVDAMTINIEASQDCYFMVWHIDVYHEMQLVYPRVAYPNPINRLQAYATRIIPAGIVIEPFGQDTIIVNASSRQFPNLEAEIQFANNGGKKQVTRGVVENVMSGRGLSVQFVPDSNAEETVSTRFNFTSVPKEIRDYFNGR